MERSMYEVFVLVMVLQKESQRYWYWYCNLTKSWYWYCIGNDLWSCEGLISFRRNISYLLGIGIVNALSQATHKNPVCSLIQDYFAIWLWGDNSCPAISSPAVKMNLLSQATHNNLVCSLTRNYFAIWLRGDIHVLHFQFQLSNWTFCHRQHTWILFALWFKTTLQSDFVVIFMSCTFKSRCQLESFVTGHTHESCLLFDSRLLCNLASVKCNVKCLEIFNKNQRNNIAHIVIGSSNLTSKQW